MTKGPHAGAGGAAILPSPAGPYLGESLGKRGVKPAVWEQLRTTGLRSKTQTAHTTTTSNSSSTKNSSIQQQCTSISPQNNRPHGVKGRMHLRHNRVVDDQDPLSVLRNNEFFLQNCCGTRRSCCNLLSYCSSQLCAVARQHHLQGVKFAPVCLLCC